MAHELVSPHCSSLSFSSNFSFSGGTAAVARTKFDAASTVTANEDRTSNSEFYEAALSPLPTVIEQGINHGYRRSLALLVNYFAAGLFHGVVPALVYPLFKIRLGLQGYQSNATQTLLGCAWHGKIFLCLLTDCVPIGGRKRTPYLYVGWILVLVIFGLMLVLDPDVSDVSDASKLILVVSAASVGVLMVDAACDGLMVETVHRDSLIEEKDLFRSASLSQSAVHSVRFIAELLGTLIVAIGMNSEQYNGGFSFELSIRGLLTILIVGAFTALGTTWWGLNEPSIEATDDTDDTDAASAVALQRLREFWRIMQQRATWQIASFGFLQKLSLSFGMDSAPPSQAIHEFWLHTDPFLKNIFLALVNGGVCVAASVFVHRCLLSTGWHSSVLLALLGGLVTGFSMMMIVVFNVWRNKFLFLVATEIVGFTDCIAMVMRMLVVVEIAESGFESSTYGLVTSVYNLADPVATALSNSIGGFFRVFDTDIEQDSKDVRMRAGALLAVLFSVRALVGLGALPLLPKQKHDARELKAQGGSSKSMALTVFVTIGVVFLAALGINFLSVFQSTACSRMAGGMGC
ncbi:putative folate-biopterin transporter 4 [Phytophthora citrophthora]|uniref:Folate-biopterin transporter 4 n=1 Tax=Phytophthora citrophthora TaxID=4793 RepID=A0AAD9GP85_9STRA|nr:putative folate-biopterin transporter 4 [Phytophthora citrophthora]